MSIEHLLPGTSLSFGYGKINFLKEKLNYSIYHQKLHYVLQCKSSEMGILKHKCFKLVFNVENLNQIHFENNCEISHSYSAL